MKIYIFVDDVRNPIDIYATTKPEEYIIARTYNEAITLLNTYKKEVLNPSKRTEERKFLKEVDKN